MYHLEFVKSITPSSPTNVPKLRAIFEYDDERDDIIGLRIYGSWASVDSIRDTTCVLPTWFYSSLHCNGRV